MSQDIVIEEMPQSHKAATVYIQYIYTVCPRSLDPIHIITYYIYNWLLWTDSIEEEIFVPGYCNRRDASESQSGATVYIQYIYTVCPVSLDPIHIITYNIYNWSIWTDSIEEEIFVSGYCNRRDASESQSGDCIYTIHLSYI